MGSASDAQASGRRFRFYDSRLLARTDTAMSAAPRCAEDTRLRSVAQAPEVPQIGRVECGHTAMREGRESLDRQAHWQNVYQTKGERDVSWFQETPDVSLDLIRATGAGKAASMAVRPGSPMRC
jgi:hypothetical protein